MKKQIKTKAAFFLSFFSTLLFPLVSFAAVNDFKYLLENRLRPILDQAVPLLIAAAVIIFFWGVLNFVREADQPDKRAEGRKFMVFGIISIFVILSVWGLVNLVIMTVFGGETIVPEVPVGPF
jgi:hypothetical protein